MQKLVVRMLDGAAVSSGDEGEGYTSRSEADSGRQVRRAMTGGGRMKRTASVPAPPPVSMLSRTGERLRVLLAAILQCFDHLKSKGNRGYWEVGWIALKACLQVEQKYPTCWCITAILVAVE